MLRPLALALALLLALPFAACGDDDPEPAKACTPGQQIECACPGGSVKGAQVCNSEGTAYGACAPCAVGQAGSGGGTPMCIAEGERCPGKDALKGVPCCEGYQCDPAKFPSAVCEPL